MNENRYGLKRPWLGCGIIPHSPQGTIKPRKSVNSVHPGRDSNHAPHYHKSEALTLVPACSIRTI